MKPYFSFLVNCLVLVIGLTHPAVASDMPPLRDGLETVPLPDFDTLEKMVRDQVVRSYQSLQRIGGEESPDGMLAKAYARFGQVLQAYGLDQSAAACYRNGVALDDSQFAWFYYLGVLAMEAGETQAAKDYFDRAKALDKSYAALWHHLGEIALSNQAFDEAEAAFQKEQQLTEYTPAALYGLGRVAMAREQYETAIDLFKQALSRLPAANRIYYSLGMAYRGLGNRELAKFCLDRSGKIGPKPVDPLLADVQRLARGERVYLTQAKTSFEAGDYASAAKLFKQGTETNPKSVTAHVGLGSALGAMGQTEAALEAYNRALELEPENLTALFNIGVILIREGQLGEAEGFMATVVQRKPEDHQARLQLADIYFNTERYELAMGHYHKLMKDTSGWKTPWFRKVQTAMAIQDYATAKLTLVEANDRFADGETRLALASFLVNCPDPQYREGNWAIELGQLLVNSTRNSTHLVLLARAYAQMNQCEAAIREAKAALELLPAEATVEQRQEIQSLVAAYQSGEGCGTDSP